MINREQFLAHVRHLWGGGPGLPLPGIGGNLAGGGPLSNGTFTDALGGQLGVGNPMSRAVQGGPNGAINSIAPSNGVQGVTPAITQMDFSPYMTAGAGNVAAGTGNMGTAFTGVTNAGAAQNNIGNALAATGPGSYQGQLGTIGGNTQTFANQQINQSNALSGAQQSLGATLLDRANGGGALNQQQASFGNTLLDQANGKGPNPAQAQFRANAQAAGQQAAGTIASARGINPALAARMGAQAEGASLQGAAGQAAQLQAQQQLAAQQAYEHSLEAQQGQQLSQEQLAQGNLNAQGQQAANTTNIGFTNAGIQSGLTGQQAGIEQAGGAQFNGAGGLYGTAGGIGASQASAGNTELATGVSGQGAQNQAVNAGSLGSQQITAEGKIADQKTKAAPLGGLANGLGAGIAGAAMAAAHGGEIPDQRAMSLAQALMANGGQVPGQAEVAGDSPRNDVVPTVLSPREVVLPRSVTMAPDAPARAAAFVEQLRAKAHPTYAAVLAARRQLADAHAKHKAAGGYC